MALNNVRSPDQWKLMMGYLIIATLYFIGFSYGICRFIRTEDFFLCVYAGILRPPPPLCDYAIDL